MHDPSWMYRDSLEALHMMNYCNEIKSFINYTLSNPRNINGDDIRCPCKVVKIISQSRCYNDTSYI